MKTPRTPFQRALLHFLADLGWGAQSKLAININKSQQLISAISHGKAEGVEDTRRKIADFFGYEYDDFLAIGEALIEAEKGGIRPDEIVKQIRKKQKDTAIISGKTSKSTVIELKHIDIIKQFQNKELATAINQRLLELEKIDPSALVKVAGYLDGMIGVYEMGGGKATDRRKSDQPDKIPRDGDRRKKTG